MIIEAATHSVGDLLNSAYDIVFIIGAFGSGLFALWRLIAHMFDKQKEQLDKQDVVLDTIVGTLSDHHARIVRAETRLDSHDLAIYAKKHAEGPWND